MSFWKWYKYIIKTYIHMTKLLSYNKKDIVIQINKTVPM